MSSSLWIWRRSPLTHKGHQGRSSQDDVNTSSSTRREDARGRHIKSKSMIESKLTKKDVDENETKARRGLNREFLYNLKSRITGKQQTAPAAPQRGTAPKSQSPAQRPAQPGLGQGVLKPQPQLHTSQPLISTPQTPRRPVNHNKPLPSLPPPGSEQARGTPVRPTIKVPRIMANLTESEIEKLFSGAPQYFARSEGHYTGAPHPSVAFPWDEALEIRDLTDHTQIEDKAWGSITAWPHITRDVNPDRSASQRASEEKRRAHFYPRCRERPNMLSMFGLEKGSLGYQAALELGVADSLQEEQWGFESLAARPHAVAEQRQKMLTSKDGLRSVDETVIMEQLIKNGKRYTEKHLRERRLTSELYNELFLHLLHPPTKVLDHRDPYSLAVQIMALVKILATPNVWIDFSHVEWRIRLGQLLWSVPGVSEGVDFSQDRPAEAAADFQEERYWLLLQILLACELLVRLDAITEGEELGTESIRPAEVHRFEKEANKTVKWSLILARVWLENIEIVKSEPAEPAAAEEKPSGWLATLTKRMSLSRDHDSHHSRPPTYEIRGKHIQRQIRGLTHFAKRLRWPGIESHASQISQNCHAVAEGIPINTSLLDPSLSDSHHALHHRHSNNSQSQSKHIRARRRKIAANLQEGGWLSKSYLSGMILPGEALCHFLMATLLENDPEARSKLGIIAILSGGLIYSGKSFWSTSCVVGRVLAAGKGAVECMGWISSDVIPQGRADGWVDIAAEELQEDKLQIDKKARLWAKQTIERESHVLGNARSDPAGVLPADFVIPTENVYRDKLPPVIDIRLTKLTLHPATNAVSTTSIERYGIAPTGTDQAQEFQTYAASITFEVTDLDSGDRAKHTFSLSKDIYFVTAHPCVPSQHVRIMKSPSSPTIRQVDLDGTGNPAGRTASVVGHPLHKYYTYTVFHLSELLVKRDASLDELLASYSSATHRPTITPVPASDAAKVLVIDCITNFQPQPQEHEIPLSPVVSRSDSGSTIPTPLNAGVETSSSEPSGSNFASVLESASQKMHSETRRRQFGSDMEVLARAICAEKGWNALISRRRRGCLACAIREAGALGWKVIIRVD